jgi:hypothetical protein
MNAERQLGAPRRLMCILAMAVGVILPSVATAKVLVLTFQGNDAAKVQAAVAAALTAAGQEATAGDTSYEDAAVLIGCDAASDDCADQVLDTLSVEEAVFGSAAKNGDVVIQRAVRGKPRRQAKVRIEGRQPLDAAVAPALRELYKEPTPVEKAEPATALAEPAPAATAEAAAPPPTVEVLAPTPEEHPYRRWSILAWSGSGAALLTGMVLWIHAGSLQDDIDKAPDGSPVEIMALQDLEGRAATSANWGNAMVVVSAGLAGVGTYFWVKGRRPRGAASAAIGPMLLPDGGGILVTIGGRR